MTSLNARECRNCGAPLRVTFADLGAQPLSNSYVVRERANAPESFYPLHAFVCEQCFLVQLEAFESPESIFGDYAYFSSYSDTWLAHSESFARETANKLCLGPENLVMEAASNDGYLLQYFRQQGIRVLGVEPARNVAAVARERNIPTVSAFLGKQTATEIVSDYGRADLVIANNVIAHVPDLHDFVEGLSMLLAQGKALSIEFPHIARLIENAQFDTIYHEHFSYFSLYSMELVLGAHGLAVYDVEELRTHGGSLRVWASHAPRSTTSRLLELREREKRFGIANIDTYVSFAKKVKQRKRDLLRFLMDTAEAGNQVAGYGAPAKGNTLLNYCGIRKDLLCYTVDRNPVKQNTLLPGSRIPVYAPDRYRETRPDYILILPWNIRDEIVAQTSYVREWGAKYVIAIPHLEVF